MFNRKSIILVILLVLLLCPATVMALTGGPDAGGYRFYDSEETDAEAFSWEDISETTIGKDAWRYDDMPIGVDIGFEFKFYGNTYRKVYISEYGYLTFDDFQLSYFLLEPIPTPYHRGGPADNFIGGLWAHLLPGA